MTPTQLIERGEVEMVPTERLHTMYYHLWYRKALLVIPKGIHKHESSHKPLIYNRVLPGKYILNSAFL